MPPTGIIIILVILVIFDVVAIILALIARNNLKLCESSESPYCPSYYCSTPTDECGNAPYRTVAGETVCQTYTLKNATTKYT